MRARGRFFRRNVEEIAADPVLRVYGSLLALVHVLTFVQWQRGGTLRRILAAGGVPICWPFFEDCHLARVLGPAGVDALLWGYLTVAVAALLLFTRRWTAPAGYFVLLALELVKVLIIAQDYRLRLNQHYMAFFVALVFLLFPAKRRALQYLIVLFYFWAGTLKLNPEWLSGASLYRRQFLWLPDALVPVACAYVVVLETILVFGLLARRPWIFWATLAQLALFHAMSWPIVGFFYPILMFALLAIFPLSRLFSAESERPSFARIEGRLEPRSTYALLAGFSLLQLVPVRVPGRLGDHRPGAALRPPHVRRAGGVRVARDAPRRPGRDPKDQGGDRAGARRGYAATRSSTSTSPARSAGRASSTDDGPIWTCRCDRGGRPRA